MSKTQKSSLPYLVQEALEAGNWTLIDTSGNAESWNREGEWVKIGKNVLRGTEPVSIIYEVSEPEINYRSTQSIVINLLCTRLAKPYKLSTWDDKVSTTTE